MNPKLTGEPGKRMEASGAVTAREPGLETPVAPAVDRAADCSPFEDGHVGLRVIIDGRRATITADPDMPEETRLALAAMVRCAFRAMDRGEFGEANDQTQ